MGFGRSTRKGRYSRIGRVARTIQARRAAGGEVQARVREGRGAATPPPTRQHSLAALAQNLEGLLLRHTAFVSETLERICTWVGTGRRKPRSNRSYPRRSLQPAPKWSRRKAATA